MQKSAIILCALVILGTTAHADWFDNCDQKAPRRVATPTAGVTKIYIEALAGTLEVNGRSGAGEIVASGTACSSEADFVKNIDLRMRRNGSELVVEAVIPERHLDFFSFNARLDFEVTVPAGIPVVIHDSSGPMKIANVGTATIDDSSGEIEVRGVRGDLVVHDSSGAIDIDDVSGDVTIDDGSGAIVVARIGGGVHVEDDGSGAIEIRDVKRDVIIDEDGSGGVSVDDVGGNFTVRRKGSGHVAYARVTGRVDVPND